MKTIHIAEVTAEGGRDGRVEASENDFAVELSSEERPDSVTPEHLFAGAYAACYLGSLKNHAEKAHLNIEGATVTGRAHLEEDTRGEYQLHVDLLATLPGVSRSDGEHLMNLAHQTCPYSKATRGNITVNLSFD
jgi:Ohr subfamily peroxiredoxin